MRPSSCRSTYNMCYSANYSTSYSKALRLGPTTTEAEVIHNNRAHANLKLESYNAALEDSTFISKPEDRSEKALYRGAQALYGMERFDDCARLLVVLIKKFPGCSSATKELSRVQQRLGEQRHGKYDFNRMYVATKSRPPKIDCATFTGPSWPLSLGQDSCTSN